jgi:Fe-S oxidoreductase
MIVFFAVKRQGIPRMTGTLPKDRGVEEAVASGSVEGIRIGLGGLEDLSRAQRLEADACVSCGLCDEACPASLVGKQLSPMRLTEAQRDLMNAAMSRGGDEKVSKDIRAMADDCTNCYACETACPLFIRKVDRISALRRKRLLEEGEALPQWRAVLKNCERKGNIFGMDGKVRLDLLEAASIPLLASADDCDYLVWLGCYGAFDPRMRKAVMALSALVRRAGKKIAAFETESCCGDMARRIGDEYLFREMVERNSRLFHRNRKCPGHHPLSPLPRFIEK